MCLKHSILATESCSDYSPASKFHYAFLAGKKNRGQQPKKKASMVEEDQQQIWIDKFEQQIQQQKEILDLNCLLFLLFFPIF